MRVLGRNVNNTIAFVEKGMFRMCYNNPKRIQNLLSIVISILFITTRVKSNVFLNKAKIANFR